ncbi:RNA 3'-terminal phosphate cyclase-like protein [Nematocida homosporus]|uniref:RNA 3'-terminal phosphate cyclase-like protein n=1 Tax=Nematocida homosporus TaxID=1912981 RepID=UPI00221F5987|nr:RNA 3'-terminal phosphate cyclase-like protein [Nematocida homosporus]KAI5184554.1 RNA 3'-terminal phosphate cyclase-like protein [Nematocida homosporus]
MEIATSDISISVTLALISRKSLKISSSEIRPGESRWREYMGIVQRLSLGLEMKEKIGELVVEPGVLRGGVDRVVCRINTIPEVLEYLLLLAGFCRVPWRLTLEGCTNSGRGAGISIDLIKSVYCKILGQFGLTVEIKIVKRAIYPAVDGEVLLLVDAVSSLKPVCWTRREELERMVSVNYSARLGSDVLHRITNCHRDALKSITSRVKVYNDIGNRTNSSGTPGYGTLLLAMGKNSVYFAEYTVDGTDSLLHKTPEERSAVAIKELLRSIRRSGAYDYKVESFVFSLLPLTSPDVSSVLIRPVSQAGKDRLWLLEKILKYTYTIEKYQRSEAEINAGVSEQLFLLKSYGVGYTNIYQPQ